MPLILFDCVVNSESNDVTIETQALEVEEVQEEQETSLLPTHINQLWMNESASEGSDSDSDTDGSNDILRNWALSGTSAIQFAQVIASKEVSDHEDDEQHQDFSKENDLQIPTADTCSMKSNIKVLRRQEVPDSSGQNVISSVMGSLNQSDKDRGVCSSQVENSRSVGLNEGNSDRCEISSVQAYKASEAQSLDGSKSMQDQDELIRSRYIYNASADLVGKPLEANEKFLKSCIWRCFGT